MTTLRTKRPPDRADRIRRLSRLFCMGMSVAGVGILFAFIGSRMIVAQSTNGGPILDNGLLLFALGALIVGPLGAGAILAAATGGLLLRGFSLRALLIATAVCGVLMAACSSLIRPWAGYRIAFPVASFVPSSSEVTIGGNIGKIHVVSGYGMVTMFLIVCALPFLTLPVIFKWRVRQRSDGCTLQPQSDNLK